MGVSLQLEHLQDSVGCDRVSAVHTVCFLGAAGLGGGEAAAERSGWGQNGAQSSVWVEPGGVTGKTASDQQPSEAGLRG